jgi:transcriptional regulator with XRE-family HTH domain
VEAAEVGRIVRWVRKRAGMTQHDLARAVAMPQPSIARIERGVVTPRTATLLAILEATGHQLAIDPVSPEVDRELIRARLRLDVPKRTRTALGRAAKRQRAGPLHILRRLRYFGVPFVLIGQLAEVARGSPVRVGRVVEVCHAPTDTARERIQSTLDDLAVTDARRLRMMTETATGDDYDMLIRNATRMFIDSGLLVPVASIDDLIRIRRAGGRPHDRAGEAMLRAIGEESTRSLRAEL